MATFAWTQVMRQTLMVLSGIAGTAVGTNVLADEAKEATVQFNSVIYMRGLHPYVEEGRDVARAIRPHTFMQPLFFGKDEDGGNSVERRCLGEAKDWGARYVGQWGHSRPSLTLMKEYYAGCAEDEALPWLVPDQMDPLPRDAKIQNLTAYTLYHWDAWKEAGVLTGEKPADIRDWVTVTESEAREFRNGNVADINDLKNPRFQLRYQWIPLSMFHPEVVRFFCDHVRAHVRYGAYPDADLAADFTDSAGTSAEDFSEHARVAFEARVRKHYSDREIAEVLSLDPREPIPLLPPEGASEELERVFRVERTKLFAQVYGQFYREIREAVRQESKGRTLLYQIINGPCYSWHPQAPLYPIYWGDGIASYMSEGGNWPGTGMRSSCVGLSFADMEQNIFDYMYGSGRLRNEPVVLKNYYHRVRNPAVAQLAVAEGLAMLGNNGIYAKQGDAQSRTRGTEVDYRWPLPMVEFAHRITPQVRQMIPAAEVGIVYSSVDRMAGMFDHIDGTFELCDMLARQNVPFQFIHLEVLRETLEERGAKTLILPWLRCVSDAQAALLEAHVREGGNLVLIGPNGTMNFGGRTRAGSVFAHLMGPPGPEGLGIREVGAGRVVSFDGQLAGYDLVSNARLRNALLIATGHDPVAAGPSRETAPLFFNLTRNSNHSRYWLHVLNYDVDLLNWQCDSSVIAPRRNLEVVVNLPPWLRATGIRVLRPSLPDEAVPVVEQGAGYAVTIPNLELYALIAVDTEARPPAARATLPPPKAGHEVADMLSASSWAASGDWRTVAGQTVMPPPVAGPQQLMYGNRAYVLVGHARTIEMEVWVSASSPADQHRHPLSYVVHDQAGRPVGSGVLESGPHQVAIRVPSPGAYALTFRAGQRWPSGSNAYSVRFTHEGGAVFEASDRMPFGTCRFSSSTPHYFFVPETAETIAFGVFSPLGRRMPSEILVRDPAGNIVLKTNGTSPARSTMAEGQSFEHREQIRVLPGQSGGVWSVQFSGEAGGREDTQFWIEGVPPLLAETPQQLIAPTRL